MISRRAFRCLCAVVAIPAVAAAGERSARVAASSGAALREWSARVDQALGMTLREAAPHEPTILTEEMLATLDRDLAAIG